MIVTAWNNGQYHSTGAGYGLKIAIEDRDTHFSKAWKSVIIKLPNGIEVEANINKSSFWSNTCRELINKEFGKWFIERGFAPWKSGRPPKFKLTHSRENRFNLDIA